MRTRLLVLALAALVPGSTVTGCRTSSDRPAPAAARHDPPVAKSRPYGLHLPAAWDRRAPAPLVVMLHGYGSSGPEHAQGLGLQQLSDDASFVLAMPDGLVDSNGRRFWNATDACCDFDGVGVDDVAYVRWILDDVASRMPIDPARVYVVGHSNGGFLALRVACELAPRVAAVVSLAGAGWKDASRCAPTEAVSVLQIQGDHDAVVRFEGGRVFDRPGREYPGALDTVGSWARLDGCDPSPASPGAPLDFDDLVPGAETTDRSFPSCRDGTSVDLWTVAGGAHVPRPTSAGLQAIWTWLAAHPKRRRP